MPDAHFCPRCGTPVAAAATPPATPAPVTAAPVPPPPPPATASTIPARVERRGGAWWIVPLVIVGLVVIAWLLLAGLPFGRDDDGRRADAPAVETIAEGTAPPASQQPTGTIVDVTETAEPPPMTANTAEPVPATIVEPDPGQTPVTRPAPVQQPPVTRPAPVQQPRPTPAPVTVPPPAPAPAAGSEISESEATNVLRGFITSRNYYDGVSSECVQLRGSGYRNVGYGFTVWDTCVSGGGSRMLGRWRVDAKTREIFRQREDGRYLSP